MASTEHFIELFKNVHKWYLCRKKANFFGEFSTIRKTVLNRIWEKKIKKSDLILTL